MMESLTDLLRVRITLASGASCSITDWRPGTLPPPKRVPGLASLADHILTGQCRY